MTTDRSSSACAASRRANDSPVGDVAGKEDDAAQAELAGDRGEFDRDGLAAEADDEQPADLAAKRA